MYMKMGKCVGNHSVVYLCLVLFIISTHILSLKYPEKTSFLFFIHDHISYKQVLTQEWAYLQDSLPDSAGIRSRGLYPQPQVLLW